MKEKKILSAEHLNNIKRSFIIKLERGEWVNEFPFAYHSDTSQKGKTKYKTPGVVTINEQEKHIVEDVFNLYAAGASTIKEIKQSIIDKHNHTLHTSLIQRILSNKFYIGIMIYGGKEYAHNYPIFISKELFNKAAKVAKCNSKYSRYSDLFKDIPTSVPDHEEKSSIITFDDILKKFDYSVVKASTWIVDSLKDGTLEEVGFNVYKSSKPSPL